MPKSPVVSIDSDPALARRRVRVGTPESVPDDRFFRHVVTSMRNGVIAIRRDGTLALMNDEAYRIFSITKGPADIGRPFGDVLRDRTEITRVLASAFDLSMLPNRAELRLRDLDRVIGYTLSQVMGDDGRVSGAVLFFKDLTQVEQQEERERLRDRLASLGEMAAGIAHELKNPLASIEVMAGLLRRHVPDSPHAHSLLADILSEAKLANAIVVEMLEFVRPIRLQVEPTSVADVLDQAVTLAESKVPRGGIDVTVTVEPALPPVDADRFQLCQLFTNLLINAYEALDGCGRVTIAAARDDVAVDPGFATNAPVYVPSVVIEVADDGPGVPPDLVDRIFNPFFTTKVKGSGLGLGIVRKIVDAHEGRIDLQRAPAGGACFRVTLPLKSGAGALS
jgi:signal transduction histidine kinase